MSPNRSSAIRMNSKMTATDQPMSAVIGPMRRLPSAGKASPYPRYRTVLEREFKICSIVELQRFPLVIAGPDHDLDDMRTH